MACGARARAGAADIRGAAKASGDAWLGPTVWQGEPAAGISVSSWRTEEAQVDRLVDLRVGLYKRRAE
ncbi:hypothetical protein WK68_24685 [Burkholderia ubonensis]|nr:hypothetical protein WK68_24685 [Burkholderia ubonensis]